MQFYKSLLSLLLITLAVIVLKLPENLGVEVNWSLPILSFNLSFSTVLVSFISAALLAILPAKNLHFSELLSFITYAISSLCAILCKEMMYVVIFLELMTISAFFIISAGCKESEPAIRYACTHFFVGVVLIAVLPHYNTNLIMLGLLINCACFPFSFWVADAYPAASLHGTTYLSFFTTKVSFLAMLLHTDNTFQNHLVFLGSITTVYAIIFASLEQNVRRFLCYNVVGQMGLLIIAGGLVSHSERAIPTLVLHIIFSLVYQSLLFIVANSVISQTKAVSFNGAGKLMSVEGVSAIIAILTMAAFPGTAGFISKSYITVEMNDPDLKVYQSLYKILNLLLYLSVGLKFIYYMFIAKSKAKSLAEKENRLPMLILAFICVAAGNPYLFIYDKSSIFGLVYNTKNIWSQFNLLLCATLLFIPLRKLFAPRVSFRMDVDWLFRSFVPYIVLLFNQLIGKAKERAANSMKNLTNLLIHLYFSNVAKLKEVAGYNSVSFVSASSLILISVLLVLLCLNH